MGAEEVASDGTGAGRPWAVSLRLKGPCVQKPEWSDFGAIWKTIREVDINAIRHEAERGVTIVCAGQTAALWWIDRYLREGPNRYPLEGDRLALVPLAEASDYLDVARSADLLILALDAATPLATTEVDALRRLASVRRSGQVTVLFGEPAGAATPQSDYQFWSAATRVDPHAPDAAAAVCGAVLSGLPKEARLAAARLLPGLRPWFAARLTNEVSMSNAAFALASGVPSLVPILGIPISAADTVILTKNQALMVYRLALACGAPPDFQKRMLEITPVIGGAVVWRQIAGALVGLVPGYGIVPKTAVAFGGTYVVGLLATRWYETGLLSDAERKRITAEATAKARDVATAMVKQARAAGGKVGAKAQGRMEGVAVGASAARARATKVSAQARDAAQRVRAGGKKALRRRKHDVVRGRRRAGLRRRRPTHLSEVSPWESRPGSAEPDMALSTWQACSSVEARDVGREHEREHPTAARCRVAAHQQQPCDPVDRGRADHDRHETPVEPTDEHPRGDGEDGEPPAHSGQQPIHQQGDRQAGEQARVARELDGDPVRRQHPMSGRVRGAARATVRGVRRSGMLGPCDRPPLRWQPRSASSRTPRAATTWRRTERRRRSSRHAASARPRRRSSFS